MVPLTHFVRLRADSKLMRFALPPEMPTLGMPLPSCLKVKRTFPNGTEPYTLDKSYSPVSLGLYPIVTLEKKLPNMIGNLV